jgi:signal transduction histidine kinase
MNGTAKCRARNPQEQLAGEYRQGLRDFLSSGGENVLGRAYELGRSALSESTSILELVSLHHVALQDILQDSQGTGGGTRKVLSAEAFLAEVLSPYEMTHRGFREAVSSLRCLNETLEFEIKRIAHVLHDEAGQLLVAVHLALAELDQELPESLRGRVGRVKEMLDQIDLQLRRLSHELRPTILDDLGLIPAIEFLAGGASKRANQTIIVHASLKERLPARIETALYRIVQEALTNAAKHSSARNVHIRLDRFNGRVRCTIRDDGTGFDTAVVLARNANGCLGLLGMRERLSALGGTLNIQSSPSQGTSLLIKLPLEGRT